MSSHQIRWRPCLIFACGRSSAWRPLPLASIERRGLKVRLDDCPLHDDLRLHRWRGRPSLGRLVLGAERCQELVDLFLQVLDMNSLAIKASRCSRDALTYLNGVDGCTLVIPRHCLRRFFGPLSSAHLCFFFHRNFIGSNRLFDRRLRQLALVRVGQVLHVSRQLLDGRQPAILSIVGVFLSGKLLVLLRKHIVVKTSSTWIVEYLHV